MNDVSAEFTKQTIGFVHLPQVWPFPRAEVIALLKKGKKIVTIENNAGAQLARLLYKETGIKPNGSILKYDGRPFYLDDVLEQIKELLK
jgi:2-oxoglutarate/2-oxoacid ferredoxin oxidoreductase subunit alpha